MPETKRLGNEESVDLHAALFTLKILIMMHSYYFTISNTLNIHTRHKHAIAIALAHIEQVADNLEVAANMHIFSNAQAEDHRP